MTSIANATPARSATPVTTTHKPEITPLGAAQVFCQVPSWNTSCKTKVIAANPYQHRITYQMCAAVGHYADWQIKDQDTGVIVGQGREPAGQCTGEHYITGLYGSYWGWVFNTRAGANAFLTNTWPA
jgi:hypothetical protein